jgi:ABC-type multidrug transport system fused ATPase/permease subunit
VDKSIYRFILRYSRRDQILILLLTVASFPTVYISLEVPKRIINDAIGGANLPSEVFGMPITQVQYLMLLCFAFLGLIIFNGGMKYFLNVYRGVVGERMLQRFRYQLFERVLRFPLPHFKRVSSGEIIPMIAAETEPLGGFIGDAFALPAFQGGLLVTYLFFIYNQDPILGLAATALYPFQLYVIPKLQRKVNLLAKDRVLTVRKLSDRIGEAVQGVGEIHAHDTTRLERADIARRLGIIFRIRLAIYKRKYFIKFFNNFLNQITPFFFYSVGGYFVIQGDLTLGALIAVLTAFKDLAGPWNELLKYYQIKEDIRVKYGQIIEQFDPPGMLAPKLIDDRPESIKPLAGELTAGNVSYTEDQVVNTVDGVNLHIDLKEQVAIVGLTGSGKDDLGRLLARLQLPTAGRLSLGGAALAEMPEAITGHRIGYVGSNSFIFAGTVRDNLCYGLKHRPGPEPDYAPAQAARRAAEAKYAALAGTSDENLDADWIDYQAAGVSGPEELDHRLVEVLGLVEAVDDLYQLGMHSTLNTADHADLAERLLTARRQLRKHLRQEGADDLVEPFDPARFNSNATVAENLVFGSTVDHRFDVDDLARHPYVLSTLKKSRLLDALYDVGQKVAETMIELFADLPPGHEFFERFSFISADDLPDYQVLLSRIKSQGLDAADDTERAKLLSLALKLTPARHRLGLINETMQARVVDARSLFRSDLPQELRKLLEFLDPDSYNFASSVQDNILFGRRAYGLAEGQARLNGFVSLVVDEMGLRDRIIGVGLGYQVGIAGGRLAPVMRQKIGLARTLVKNPDLLILNEATDGMDSQLAGRTIKRILEHMENRGVICVMGRPKLAKMFQKVMIMEEGKITEQGSFPELAESSARFKALLES